MSRWKSVSIPAAVLAVAAVGLAAPAHSGPANQTVTWAPNTTITTATAAPSALATTDGDGAITYAVTDAGATGCTVNATSAALTFTGTGSCEITATAAATGAWGEGTAVVTFTVNKANPTIDWADQTLVLTDSPWTPDATSDSTGTISYTVTVAGTANCSFAAGKLSFTAVGECDVQVDITATTLFNADTATATISVRNEQTVSWAPELNVTTSTTAPSALAATDGDGAITYAVTDAGTTGCTVNATTGALTFTASGNCEITATAAQTATYAEGTKAVVFVVGRSNTTITWNPTVTILATATAPSSLATTNSDGALTYAVTDDLYSGCMINSTSGAMTFVTSGICEVTATVARTAKFAGATKTVTFTVAKAQPTIRWSNANVGLSQSPWTPSPAATTTSGGAITYAVKDEGTAMCSWDASSRRLVFAQAGSCTVSAASASTPKYAFGSRDAVITVSKAVATLTWSDRTLTLAQSPWVMNATTNSDGKITYTVADPGTTSCSVEAATKKLSFTAPGVCVVTATTAATDNYGSVTKAAKITVSGSAGALGSTAAGPVMSAANLAPGRAIVLVDGKAAAIKPKAIAKNTQVRLADSGWSLTMGGVKKGSTLLPLQVDVVQLREGGRLSLAGLGLAPGSDVQVFFLSGPVQSQNMTVDAGGAFKASVPVPSTVEPGEDVIQVQVVTASKDTVVASLGVEVVANQAAGIERLSASIDFAATSTRLTPADDKTLADLVAELPKKARNIQVSVTGYGPQGADAAVQARTGSRADAVAKALRDDGLQGTYRVSGAGVGTAKPNRVTVVIAYQK